MNAKIVTITIKCHSRPFQVVNISYKCQLKFGASVCQYLNTHKKHPEVVFKFTCLLLLCYHFLKRMAVFMYLSLTKMRHRKCGKMSK